MSKTITDRLILKTIHDIYYDTFVKYDTNNPSHADKNYIPIDCEMIATKLKVDPEIIFGRLHYHLDKKYSYTSDDGNVPFFTIKFNDEMHLIHFPLLSAVLAEYEQSYYRFTMPMILSIAAIILSIISLAF